MLKVHIEKDSYVKKDGSCALYLIISGNGKAKVKINEITIPRGVNYNGRSNMVNKAFGGRSKTEINRILRYYLMMLEDHLREVGDVTAAEAKRSLNKEVNENDFYEYFEKNIEKFKSIGKNGTARARKETMQKLKKFSPYTNFSHFNLSYLEAFDRYMINQGLKPNSRATHFRHLRAVLNAAFNEGIYSSEPFRKFSIPREITRKRHISVEEIKAIASLKVKGWEKIAQDYFVNSFRLAGISFVDMYNLTTKDIVKSRVEFRRAKINENKYRPILKLWVSPEAKKFIQNKELPSNYGNYRYVLKKVNKNLKDLAKKAEIESPEDLTTHVVRHSWATVAKRQGYSKDLISEILGHKVPGSVVTDIYTDEFEQDVKDDCIRKMCSLLN